MKKNLLLALLVTYCSYLNAQYIPLIAESKYWFYDGDDGDIDHPKQVSSFLIKFQGDTSISNVNYKKVIRQGLKGSHPCQFPPCFKVNIPYEVFYSEIIGFGREDTSSRKVYFLPVSNASPKKKYCSFNEFLWFDYSLKKSDTLNSCAGYTIFANKINYGYIDSIGKKLAYKKIRKTIYTKGLQGFYGLIGIGKLRIYEGVGFENFGILTSADGPFWFRSLCEGSLKDCNFLTAINAPKEAVVFKIYPNPVSSNFTIDAEEPVQKIQIFNANGLEILSASFTNQVLMENFPTGMYFVKITFQNGASRFEKIMKY